MNSEHKRVHEIIKNAFDEAGIIDGFYCGLLIDGTDISSFSVGIQDKTEYSNMIRFQRLLGVVEQCKHSLLMICYKESEEISESDAENL